MTEPMKTAKEIMYKTFDVSSKLDMMKNQFIGLADQGKIVVAMQEYAAQQVAAERERIKKELRSRITFWNSATQKKEPKYSYKSIFELIDSL